MQTIEGLRGNDTVAQITLARHDTTVKGIEPSVREMLDGGKYLAPLETIWQPSDHLPNLQSDEWEERVSALREEALEIPDALWVGLVGNTVTEDALPTYQTWLNRTPVIRDATGVDQSAWARWSRGWTGEERRHGDALHTYIYLSGRVHMAAFEKTVHGLLANGFDPGVGQDPYNFFIYTAFQERATQISHRNTGALAKQVGANTLARICGVIAGDERRHGLFYADVMRLVFEADTEHALIAFDEMLRNGILMPAALMTEAELMDAGNGPSDLYQDYAAVSHALGIYTAADYVQIVRELSEQWNVGLLSVEGDAARAQDRIQKYTESLGKRLDAAMSRKYLGERPNPSFPWIYGESVPLADLRSDA